MKIKEMTSIIDNAIAEFHEQHPRHLRKMRIAWGFANKEDEREEKSMPSSLRQHEALLSFGDRDYEILLSKSGDPDAPDRCNISTRFQDDFALPHHDVRKLYNALAAVESGVSLSLIPDADDPEIDVTGVRTTLPVESITGRTLYAALSDLDMSVSLIRARLITKEDDYDSWSADGGGY